MTTYIIIGRISGGGGEGSNVGGATAAANSMFHTFFSCHVIFLFFNCIFLLQIDKRALFLL